MIHLLAPLVMATTAAPPKLVLINMTRCCRRKAVVAVEKLLRPELESAGFKIQEVVGKARSKRERRIELGIVSEEHNALGALRVLREKQEVVAEVWVTHRGAGQSVFKRLPAQGDPEEVAPVLALRIVEVLREVSGEPFALPPPPKPPEPEPEPVVIAKPAPPPSPKTRAVGIRASVGLGALDGSPHLSLHGALRWDSPWRMGVELRGGTNALQDGLSAGGNKATLRSWDATAGLDVGFDLIENWEARVGAVGGIVGASIEGEQSAGLTSQTDSTTSGYVGAQASLAYTLHPLFRLRAAAHVGGLLSEVAVEFPDGSRSNHRLPVWSVDIGPELRL